MIYDYSEVKKHPILSLSNRSMLYKSSFRALYAMRVFIAAYWPDLQCKTVPVQMSKAKP